MKFSHYPLPWATYETDEDSRLFDIDHIANGSLGVKLPKADAEFIVMACNNHERLRNACKSASDKFSELQLMALFSCNENVCRLLSEPAKELHTIFIETEDKNP